MPKILNTRDVKPDPTLIFKKNESRRKHPLRFSHFKIIAGILFLQSSCASVSSIGRQEQSIDGLTGGGNLAMVAVRSTALATLSRPINTVKLGFAVLWNRPREILIGNIPIRMNHYEAIREKPGTSGFDQMLDSMNFPATESGKLGFLVDGPQFFKELDHQIASANKSIHIQLFIFDNDDIAVRYAEALKQRSTEVKVKVLYDDLGSNLAYNSAPETLGPSAFNPPSNMSRYLRKNSAVRARRSLNPWLVCDHTKLLVFDQQTAFIGGMNIGREYFSEWHDLMIRVEGPIVQTLTHEFDLAWKTAGPLGDFAYSRKPKKLEVLEPVPGTIPLRILRTDPAEGRYEILDATLLAIRGARHRIWIETPYFSHDEIAHAIEAAARRGVDVRVIIPSGKNPTLMDTGNLSTARALIQAGAKIYRYPNMTHLKAIICDDWACVGSANLDMLSMRINRELNLSFTDQETIKRLEQSVFRTDFKRSSRVSLEHTEGILNQLSETIADQL